MFGQNAQRSEFKPKISLRSVNLERGNRKSDANVTGADTTNIGGGRSGSIARGNESPESPVRGQALPHGCDYTPRHSPQDT